MSRHEDRSAEPGRTRLERERAFFTRLAAEERDIAWAERTAVAAARREMRAVLLYASARVRAGAGDRVLDVGCGTGTYTLPFADRSQATIVGINATPTLLERARAALPARVHLAGADAAALPFPDDTFDAVIGNAILHHVSLDETVPEIVRILKPGGRFCFAEPNLLNPHLMVVLNVPWLRRALDGTPDETAFVRWRLRRRLEALGLTAVSIRPFDFLYPLTPRRLVPAVEALGRRLERLPLVREIAGSLLITAEKPDRAQPSG